MSLADYRAKGVPADMSEAEFLRVLREAASPVSPGEARAVYSYCVARTLSPAFLLGMFRAESRYGTDPAAICVAPPTPTHSWGNTTAPSFGTLPAPGLVRGRFNIYHNWADGGVSTVARLFDHRAYANAFTVREIVPIWAPSSENDVERYIATVLDEIERWAQPQEQPGMDEPTIIDIREELPTAPGQGSGLKRNATLGQVLHYSAVNYPPSRPILDILKGEAAYHIDPHRPRALKEAGLAYHQTVDPQTGDIYLCRDEDDLLWHCGYWGPGGNGTGLAIHVPGGSSLAMSARAVQSLCWLLERNEKRYGFGRNMLRGHLEVSQTDCPGPLMAQVVKPYRAGTLRWEGTTMSKAPIVDAVTGHTVHPELADSYDFAKHGRPLLPAVLYSDGVIRQLFERSVLAVGQGGKPDTIETLGHAWLYAVGSGAEGQRYPEWPGVVPLV